MLYVVASELTCSVNISLPGNAVHESDFVEINCTTEYSGSWMPVINCNPEVPGQLVEETSSSSQVYYTVVMAAADIGDLAVISCETRFVLSECCRPVSNQFERVLNTPQYHHTWHTSPIRVFNTTGNIHRICTNPTGAVALGHGWGSGLWTSSRDSPARGHHYWVTQSLYVVAF